MTMMVMIISQTSGLAMAKIPSNRALLSHFLSINSLNIEFQLEQSVNPDSKVTPDELLKSHKGTRRACSCTWGAAELQKLESRNCSAKNFIWEDRRTAILLNHTSHVKQSDQTSMATPCLVEIMSLVPVRYMSTEQRWGRVAVMVTYSQ